MTRIYTDDNGVYANAFTSLADGTDVAGHMYAVQAKVQSTMINFQRGPVKEFGVNGLTSEALLAILIHRTEHLNGLFPCGENEVALAGLRTALVAFESRTANRKARGVEGTNQA